MASRAFVVAAVAAAALVVSIGFDAAMNRSYVLEAKQGDGWIAIAQSQPYGTGVIREPMGGSVVVPANGTVEFRLRETNTYFWASSTTWEARVNGASYAHGTLSSPPRGEAEVKFGVPASAWTSLQQKPTDSNGTIFASLELQVEGTNGLYGSFQLKEAS